MKLARYLLTVAAASMAVAPALAAPANPAASLSLSKARVGTTTAAKKDKLAGGGLIIALIAAAAVVAGVVIVATDDNSDSN